MSGSDGLSQVYHELIFSEIGSPRKAYEEAFSKSL
jgi:hypothetical protein